MEKRASQPSSNRKVAHSKTTEKASSQPQQSFRYERAGLGRKKVPVPSQEIQDSPLTMRDTNAHTTETSPPKTAHQTSKDDSGIPPKKKTRLLNYLQQPGQSDTQRQTDADPHEMPLKKSQPAPEPLNKPPTEEEKRAVFRQLLIENAPAPDARRKGDNPVDLNKALVVPSVGGPIPSTSKSLTTGNSRVDPKPFTSTAKVIPKQKVVEAVTKPKASLDFKSVLLRRTRMKKTTKTTTFTSDSLPIIRIVSQDGRIWKGHLPKNYDLPEHIKMKLIDDDDFSSEEIEVDMEEDDESAAPPTLGTTDRRRWLYRRKTDLTKQIHANLKEKRNGLTLQETGPVKRSNEMLRLMFPDKVKEVWNRPTRNSVMQTLFCVIKEKIGWTGPDHEMETSVEYEELIVDMINHFDSNEGLERYNYLKAIYPQSSPARPLYVCWSNHTLRVGKGKGTSPCGSRPKNCANKCMQCWNLARGSGICESCLDVHSGNKLGRARSTIVLLTKPTNKKAHIRLESLGDLDDVDQPASEKERFKDMWYPDSEIEDHAEQSPYVPYSTTHLFAIGSAIKEKLNFKGTLDEMTQTPEFHQELKRWTEVERKEKDIKKYRPLYIQVPGGKPGEYFNLRCNEGTIWFGVGETEVGKDGLLFSSSKCRFCWRNSGGATDCYEHNTQIRHIGILKDSLNLSEDVYLVFNERTCVGHEAGLRQSTLSHCGGIHYDEYIDSRDTDFQLKGTNLQVPGSKPNEISKYLDTLKLAVSMAVTLRNQEVLADPNAIKSRLIHNTFSIKSADFTLVRRLLKQWGITFSIDGDSEWGTSNQSPLIDDNFCPKFPFVYVAFKTNGYLYDGFRTKPCTGHPYHSEGHATSVAPSTRKPRSSLGRGIRDFTLLKSIPVYQTKLSKEESKMGWAMPISRKPNIPKGYTDLREKVTKEMERGETLSMISTVLCVILNQKMDGFPIKIVEDKISYHINECVGGDREVITKLFGFKSGKLLNIKVDLSQHISTESFLIPE